MLLSCFSCSEKLHGDGLGNYIYNTIHGLTVEDTFGNLKVSCTYIPVQYAAWQESKLKGESYKDILKEMKEFQFWELRLSDSSGTKEFLKADNNPLHYQERLNYLLHGLQNDIIIIEGNDTLTVLDIHLERLYGIVNYNKVLLTFKRVPENDFIEKNFLIRDRQDKGKPMRFLINSEDLKKLPTIRIKRKIHDIPNQQTSL